MMSIRAFTILFACIVIVTGIIALVLHIQQQDATRALSVEKTDAARVCISSKRVRNPFERYISSEVTLINTAKKKGIPLGPPALAKLQQQSFANLITLRDALKAATQLDCKP